MAGKKGAKRVTYRRADRIVQLEDRADQLSEDNLFLRVREGHLVTALHNLVQALDVDAGGSPRISQ